MGKRKRALSPKDNPYEQAQSSSTNCPKAKALENKKDVIFLSEANEIGKSEVQDKATSNNSSTDPEVPADDRPIPQLRISARVQNKQRREESKDLHSLLGLARKVDGASQDEEEEEEKKASGTEGDRGISHNGELKKRRRAWELWSLEDKNTFFEAINECGKDFEAIQNFLVTKLRKKGIPSCVIKNKDQVRHFYYRTWHKISKHIKFDDDVKKSTQELYTLINYGELRRKIGGTLDEKKGQKLQELIQKGSTSVRIKGKTVRVKTPICRALKKLNEFPDEREQTGVRVPVSVTVEIVPANIRSWNQVQSVAHNPRVRITSSMHKSVASIIEHLQTKWRSTKLKICDNLISSANFPVDCTAPPPMTLKLSPPPFTDFNNVYLKADTQVKSFAVSLSSHSQMLQRKGEMELLNPKSKSSKTTRKKKITPPISESLKEKPPEEVESKDLKDDSKYKDEEKGEISQEETEDGSDVEVEEELGTPPPVVISSSDEYLSNKEEEVVFISCHSPKRQPVPFNSGPSEPLCIEVKEDSLNLSPSYEEEVLNAVKNIKVEVTDPMETIHQLMALENVANTQEIEDDADVICIGERTKLSAQIGDTQKKLEEQVPSTSTEQEELKSPIPLDNVPAGDETYLNFTQAIEKAKKGWTLKTCGVTTIGELYLMFGKNQQISLEYEFEELEASEEETITVLVDDTESNKVEDGLVASCSISEPNESNITGINSSTVASTLASPVRPTSSSQNIKAEPSPLCSPISKPAGTSGEESSSNNTSENDALNKNKTAENISSMLAKLIYMIKIISSKGPVECVCGNVAPSKHAFSHLRSPSNTRHLNGYFKSPGNTKSPRGCSLNVRSPRTPTSANSQRDGGPSLKTEKSKPTSAKRLIPESSSDKNGPSTSSVDSVPNSSKDQGMDTKREASVGVIINSKDLPMSTAGEFRVPIAPAPRNPACQVPNQSFNAQLSKLLPRYSRPSRRSVRKNMVVQRQLPLMPRQPRTSRGFVAVKVGNLQEFNINTAPQISLPIAVSMQANSLANNGTNQVCSSGEVQQSIPSILIQQQPSQASMPIIAGTFVNEPTDNNAISVNVSGHQLLTVKMPSYPVASVVTTVTTVSSITHSSTVSFATSSETVSTTTTCALPLMSDASSSTMKQIFQDTESNSSFSNLLAQNFGDPPYLTTPPSTPIQFDNLLNTPSSISKEELNCYNENSNSSYISISDIDVGPLSTPIKSNLISVPATFSESSLLQTPTHNSNNFMGNKTSIADISPIKLNLSSFLSSPNSILNSTRIDTCTTQNEEDIPQIHIPECGDNLPMLDISIGGTISLKEGSTNLVSDIPVRDIAPISSISTLPSMSNFINDTTSVSETQSIISRVSQVPSIVGITNVSSMVHMSSVDNAIIPMSNADTDIVSSSNVGSVMSLDPQAISSQGIGSGLQHSQVMMNHIPQGQTLINNIMPSSTVVGILPHLSTATSSPHSAITVVNSNGSSNIPDPPTGISLSVTCVTTSVTTVGSTSRRENMIEEPIMGLNSFQDSNDKMMDLTLSNSNSNSSFASFLNAAVNNPPCLDSVMENSLLQTPPRPLLSGGVSCGTKSNLSFDGEGFGPLTEVPLSPPSSPSRLLRHTEVQWINTENEFSLSSLLNSMDSSSPLKGVQAPPVGPSISQNPQIRALFSTLNDNSVDFTSTFASLKNQTKEKDRSE